MKWYSQKEAKEILGFNDLRVRLIVTPIMAFIIPPVFFPDTLGPYPLAAFTAFIHVVSYWEGNRQIVIHQRVKYPKYEDVGKRLIIQMLWVTLYCTIVAIGLKLLFKWLQLPDAHADTSYGYSIVVGLVNTYICLLFYECANFFQNWKRSVIEAERLKLEKAETQLESLKNQVNPHFLFNSMNTLSALIPRDPDKAVLFVQKLSEVYRYVLDINATRLVRLEKELAFIRAYIFLLKTRHGERLHVNLDISAYYHQHCVIPLALQILLENAVKHNVVSERHPLEVSIFIEGDKLIVSHPLQRKKHAPPSSGYGLKNIRSRYLLVCGEGINIQETAEEFRVAIPLVAQVQRETAPLIS